MKIHNNIYYSQAANCWLFIQVGYTGFSFGAGKAKFAHKFNVFAPKYNPDRGYYLGKFGFRKGVRNPTNKNTNNLIGGKQYE